MKIHSEIYRRRTDIVGFVNGIPLLFVELKRNDVAVQNAYDDNYTDYLSTIPQLFYYNAFLMLSNGVEAKVGTLGSKYDFFHEWKRLKESDAGSVALQTKKWVADKCSMKKELHRIEQRIKWHLTRLYRTRNAIIHFGEDPEFLKELGEHLHYYADICLKTIILQLVDFKSIDVTIIDVQLKMEFIWSMLEKNSDFVDADLKFVVALLSNGNNINFQQT